MGAEQSSVITFAPFTRTALFSIVIRAFVTLDAVIGESNPFFAMLSAHVALRMLMTAVAGVATVIVVQMAG